MGGEVRWSGGWGGVCDGVRWSGGWDGVRWSGVRWSGVGGEVGLPEMQERSV